MRKLITLCLWFALLALLAGSSRFSVEQSASTGQGKGGEVVAKPTPTKARTTSKAPSRSTGKMVSLEGTTWVFKGGLDGGELAYEFLADGEMEYSGTVSGKGIWKQTGTRVAIAFGDASNGRVETGTVRGNRMNGTGRYVKNGRTKTHRWSAKRKR